MAHGRSIALLFALALAGSSAPAQVACDAPSRNAWLHSGPVVPETGPHIVVPAAPVERDMSRAILALERNPVIALRPADVTRFGVTAPTLAPGVTPYLVRAVYPTARPHITAGLDRTVLRIHASGMGCAPFLKHPIIVWLAQAPKTLVVTADAAL